MGMIAKKESNPPPRPDQVRPPPPPAPPAVSMEKTLVIDYLIQLKALIIRQEADAMAKSETGSDRWAGRSEGCFQALQAMEALEKKYGLSVPTTSELILAENIEELKKTDAGRKWLGERIAKAIIPAPDSA